MVTLTSGDALIVVDIRHDFLPGGALGVPQGDEVMPVLRQYATRFDDHGLPIFATRDWHPPNHCSFREQGGVWPRQCVAGTTGAERPASFRLPARTVTISKGTAPDREADSGFQGTTLDQQLKDAGGYRLFLGGLATESCVLETVKDALDLGYEGRLLADATRSVNRHPDDGAKAREEALKKRAVLTSVEEVTH